MASVEKQLINGFMVNGYRSFHGEPQKIAPLGRMNLFAGTNNSGKSNILLAAHTWIPLCGRGSSTVELGELDLPQLRDDEPVPPTTFAIALRLTNDELVALLLDASNSRRKRGEDIQRFVEFLLRLPDLCEEQDGGYTMWVEWEWSGNSLGPSRQQAQRLAQGLGEQDRNLLNSFAAEHLSQHGSAQTELLSVLDMLRATFVPPPISIVPAIREVRHDAALGHEEWGLDGLGLPRLIQTWLAPTAANHRRNRRKYEQLNRFLRVVLEDQAAEIGSPFNGDTVHISLGDLTLPLSNLGTGYAQITLLAAIATERDSQVLCIEEPELHLHPTLLRRLLNYLMDYTTNQYLISTHSAHMLDSPSVTLFRTSHNLDTGTQVSWASAASGRAEIARRLGYRPSDLIQANVIIWVEGPSDRIYLNHWIKCTDPSWIEGIHYSIMVYGGALIKHLTAGETEEQDENRSEFISLLGINRRMIMMIDSDKPAPESPLAAVKTRLEEELRHNGGLPWITAGREVENYLPIEVFTDAAQKIHSHSTVDGGPSEGPFEDLAKRVSTNLSKVPVALAAVESSEGKMWDVLDLRTRMAEVVTYIRVSNEGG